MYPVRVLPASRPAWVSPAIPDRPPMLQRTATTSAGLDALCPCCDQRGLDLCPVGPDRTVVACRHCGYVGDG
jgi:hypothetical protein